MMGYDSLLFYYPSRYFSLLSTRLLSLDLLYRPRSKSLILLEERRAQLFKNCEFIYWRELVLERVLGFGKSRADVPLRKGSGARDLEG